MQCDIVLAVCAHYAALVTLPDIASSQNVFSFPFVVVKSPPPDPATTADLAAPSPGGRFFVCSAPIEKSFNLFFVFFANAATPLSQSYHRSAPQHW
jgi:hypothetical protein